VTGAGAVRGASEPGTNDPSDPNAALEAERRDLDARREALETERAALAAERAALQEERDALAAQRAEIDELRAEIDAERAALEGERERQLVKEKGKLTKEGEALLDGVKKAREDLRAAQSMMKQSSPAALKEAERKIAAVAQQVALGGALEPRRAEEADRASVRAVTVGMKVFVPRLRTEADVIEVLANGQVRVAAGPLKLLTSVDELRQAKVVRPSPQKSLSKAEQARRAPAFDAASDPDLPIQTADNSVDLRGLRAHEAVAMAEQFLDRCVGHALRVAFLIHGHGTGALRQAIRDAVRSSPYVARSRPGEGREGGDGVTVVWLK
jgi:DNA mismatch repair protein MutS2